MSVAGVELPFYMDTLFTPLFNIASRPRSGALLTRSASAETPDTNWVATLCVSGFDVAASPHG